MSFCLPKLIISWGTNHPGCFLGSESKNKLFWDGSDECTTNNHDSLICMKQHRSEFFVVVKPDLEFYEISSASPEGKCPFGEAIETAAECQTVGVVSFP